MQILTVFAGGPSPPASENRSTTLHHPHRHQTTAPPSEEGKENWFCGTGDEKF